jgi:hypothetical protein
MTCGRIRLPLCTIPQKASGTTVTALLAPLEGIRICSWTRFSKDASEKVRGSLPALPFVLIVLERIAKKIARDIEKFHFCCGKFLRVVVGSMEPLEVIVKLCQVRIEDSIWVAEAPFGSSDEDFVT